MTSRTLILHPVFPDRRSNARTPESQLEEAAGLAHAIDLEVVSGHVIKLHSVSAASMFGTGKIKQLADEITASDITLVIVNHSLSPGQQRNLEEAWGTKVIDRTALILEIFGARAKTSEGQLQVELASLEYQKSRLVRSWTHLERQRGGFGFMGGPGESQLEVDRRLTRDRIIAIKKQLEKVVRTRGLHRKVRREIPYPMIALAGYTNAGKSTLFNRLTNANVVAKDALFATLDPTIRRMKLPSGMEVMLSDTVGFISDLPTELVAAFRATLEEVVEADLILHVRDISHPDTEAQRADVEKILKSLLGEEHPDTPVFEVWNKIDQCDHVNMTRSTHSLFPDTERMAISALTGEGVPALLEQLEKALTEKLMKPHRFTISCGNGKAIAWLHAHGHVTSEKELDGMLHMEIKLTDTNNARFSTLFPA